MDTIDITTELRAIKDALDRRSAPTITGGQLAALIRSAAPDLDIRSVVAMPKGPGALTEFTQRHLSESVERIGKQGADTLHRLLGREVADLPASASPQVWRTFVSPNSPLHLVLSRSARWLIVRDTPASGADEVEVPKASPAEHDRMRTDFVASMPEAAAAVLRDHSAPDADFGAWIMVMKERLPEETRRWGQYRRRCLSDLLASRIVGMALEETLQRALLEQVRASEHAAYEAPKRNKTTPVQQPVRTPTGVGNAADATSQARRLAHQAIDLLAYDELRALKLPLGAMLDAIRAKA